MSTPENAREPIGLSLAARVALAVAGVLFIGGIVVSLAAFAYGRQAAREAYDRLLVGAANDIAASISLRDGMPVVDLPLSAFELLALAPDDRIIYRVIGPDGKTVTGYEAAPAPEDGQTVETRFYDADFGEEAARYVSVARRFAERNFSGTLYVIVGHTGLARQALAIDITRNALIVLAIIGIAITLLTTLAVRSALGPLDRIGDALRRRDHHDLTPVDLSVPRDAAVMLGALNGFMARLDRQMSSMRNLIGDTAHQLRTPVAAIRAQAELGVEENDPARQRKIFERIHHRSVRLGRLLDQMLSRALVIHRADSAVREAFDLRDLAVEVLEDSEHDETTASADVRLDLPATSIPVTGDRLSLAEACKNLLNNAVHHGLPPIRIGAKDEGSEVRIFVSDAGNGPPDDILLQKGERFARSAASKPDSAGLGLAIAAAVAEAHGGRLDMNKTDNPGFTAGLVLPKSEIRA